MSTDTQTSIEEPVDDAVVVHDEQTPEQANDDLVAKVAKKLGRDEWGNAEGDAASTVSDPAESTEETTEETPSEEESKDEKPVLSKDLQARAEKAGLDKDLAARLHQSGQLEDTLAAFDRTMIARFQGEPEKPTVTKEPVEDEDQSDLPDLDPEIYDEEIVKRDRHHKERIDMLQTQLDILLQDRQEAFENWFDGVLSELGYDIEDVEKCQRTFKAYKGLCEANDVSPEKRDRALAERAHAAMFPDEVKKRNQKETVDRLRYAEGKFLTSSKAKGAPPPKNLTPDEAHDHLVSQVTSYLKKTGAKMSGY